MTKKTPRLKFNEKRRYMGVWIDKDTHDALMHKAYKQGDSLSRLVRDILDNIASNPAL